MNTDVEFDEFCDPNNPRKIVYDDIVEASKRIEDTVMRTPCPKSHVSDELGMEIYIKLEVLQFSGCFKERGVRNALLLLTDDQKKNGVIAASTGNHAIALSYHSQLMGVPCVIVLPNNVPINKCAKIKMYGAEVIFQGNNILEAKTHAMTIAKEKRKLYINGYDHPHIIEGNGSIAIEIIEQVPEVDAILVPVGGGSLLAGVAVAAKHLKPETAIYGIETERTNSMTESLRKNERIFLEIDSTIADGLAVNKVGVNSFHAVKGLAVKMIAVSEDWIARAILHMVEKEKFVVEGAGAVGIASVMAGLVPELAGKKVVCILSGGNIDITILGRCLERGLAADLRLIKFRVTVTDKPGGIAELCKVIASIGVTVKHIIMQERAWVRDDMFSVRVKVICETQGPEQLAELRSAISAAYKQPYFDHDDSGDAPDKCRSKISDNNSMTYFSDSSFSYFS